MELVYWELQLMKSRQIVVGKMENFSALTPADDGSFYFARNLRFITQVRRLADNKSRDNLDGDNDEPYNFSLRFNRPVQITVILLICVLFFIAVFSIFARRRARRAFEQAVANNNNYREAAQGLERTVIGSFPVFSYNRVKGLKAHPKCSECSVCLTDFKEYEMLRLLPKCSHAFHPECIDTWLFSNTTCPVCRTSLLPGDDSNSTVTEFGALQPQAPQVPPEEVAVVIDNEHGISNRTDISNDEATIEAPGNDSTGHSLVRVQKELEQGTKWYIATAEGLTPGLHWSCTFVANRHSQEPSTSSAPPTCSKPGETDRGSRSERWGSVSDGFPSQSHPPSLERSFSDGFPSQSTDQFGVERQDGSFEEDVELVDGKRHTRKRDGPLVGGMSVLQAYRSKWG